MAEIRNPRRVSSPTPQAVQIAPNRTATQVTRPQRVLRNSCADHRFHAQRHDRKREQRAAGAAQRIDYPIEPRLEFEGRIRHLRFLPARQSSALPSLN